MKAFEHILCVVDTEAPEHAALTRAVAIAKAQGARLTVVGIVPRIVPASDGAVDDVDFPRWQASLVEDRQRALTALTEAHRHTLPIEHRLLVGTAFLEIIRAVLEKGHDLVIKDAEQPVFLKRLFGSNDMHLLRKCPCPVWLVKASDRARYRRIVAAIDVSTYMKDPVQDALNGRVLDLAGKVAIGDGARLDVVHAWEAPGEMTLRAWSDREDTVHRYVDAEYRHHQNAMDAVRSAYRESLGAQAYDQLAPLFHLERGPATQVIPAVVGQLGADLVVMGTVARVGIAGLLIGNTAESILDQLDCAVLAVKPPGFESPVRPAG
jgi:universal stress protein E